MPPLGPTQWTVYTKANYPFHAAPAAHRKRSQCLGLSFSKKCGLDYMQHQVAVNQQRLARRI